MEDLSVVFGESGYTLCWITFGVHLASIGSLWSKVGGVVIDGFLFLRRPSLSPEKATGRFFCLRVDFKYRRRLFRFGHMFAISHCPDFPLVQFQDLYGHDEFICLLLMGDGGSL